MWTPTSSCMLARLTFYYPIKRNRLAWFGDMMMVMHLELAHRDDPTLYAVFFSSSSSSSARNLSNWNVFTNRDDAEMRCVCPRWCIWDEDRVELLRFTMHRLTFDQIQNSDLSTIDRREGPKCIRSAIHSLNTRNGWAIHRRRRLRNDDALLKCGGGKSQYWLLSIIIYGARRPANMQWENRIPSKG